MTTVKEMSSEVPANSAGDSSSTQGPITMYDPLLNSKLKPTPFRTWRQKKKSESGPKK